ncbi:MAG: transcriptional regulator [Herbinix sp.]|jgi:AcrR family transcriptional regulator|nr:transcriptional regulator [Herbinix sp.]
MTTEENKKNRIMEHALKSFTTTGFSRVTMDDIARGVGMGKGTVYKLFPSKEALVFKTIDFFANRIERSIEAVLSNEKLTTVEKLNLFLKTIAEKLASLNPSALENLERSMPEAFEKIEKTRQRIILTNLVRLLEDGKKSGVFEPDMDEYLVSHILIGAIQHILETKVLTTLDYTFDRLFTSITTIIFKGCLTEEGRKLTYKNL